MSRNSTQAPVFPVRHGSRLGTAVLAAALAGTVLVGCGSSEGQNLLDPPPDDSPPVTNPQPEQPPATDTQPETPAPGDSGDEQAPPEDGGTPSPGGDQDGSNDSTGTTS